MTRAALLLAALLAGSLQAGASFNVAHPTLGATNRLDVPVPADAYTNAVQVLYGPDGRDWTPDGADPASYQRVAAAFDGVATRIALPSPSPTVASCLPFGAWVVLPATYEVSLIANAVASATGNNLLVKIFPSAGIPRFIFRIGDGASNYTQVFFNISAAKFDGGWHYVEVLRAGNTISLRIDGAVAGSSSAWTATPGSPTPNFSSVVNFVGWTPGGGVGASWYAGQMADITLGGYARYPLESGAGSTAYNTVTNANHGTIATGAGGLDTFWSGRVSVAPSWNLERGFAEGLGDIVRNGSFDAGAAQWNLTGAVAVTNGQAVLSLSTSTIALEQTMQTGALLAGATYRLTFDHSKTSGSSSLAVSSGGFGAISQILATTAQLGPGTTVVDIVCLDTTKPFRLVSATPNGWAGTLDNFSLVDLDSGVQIPALLDGDAAGNPVTHPGGAVHNGANTLLAVRGHYLSYPQLRALAGANGLGGLWAKHDPLKGVVQLADYGVANHAPLAARALEQWFGGTSAVVRVGGQVVTNSAGHAVMALPATSTEYPPRTGMTQWLTGTADGEFVEDAVGVLGEPRYTGIPCLAFDGSSTHVVMPTTIPSRDKFVVEASIVLRSDFSFTLCGGGTSTTGLGCMGFESSGAPRFALRIANAAKDNYVQYLTGGLPQFAYLYDNEYHTVRFELVTSTSAVLITIDGITVGSGSLPGAATADAVCTWIGRHNMGAVGQLYNRATMSWIKFYADDVLLRHYNFEESSGLTCYNVLANSNHGTITTSDPTTMRAARRNVGTSWNALNGYGRLELVRNGGFGTDTLWTKQSSWSISNGAAVCNHLSGLPNRNMSQITSLTFVEGASYRVEFTITEVTSGTVQVNLGGYSGGPLYGTPGRKSYIHVVNSFGGSANAAVYLSASSTGFIGKIDDFSVIPLALHVPALASGASAADGNPITNPGGTVHNGGVHNLAWGNGTNTYAELMSFTNNYGAAHAVTNTTGAVKELLLYSAPQTNALLNLYKETAR